MDGENQGCRCVVTSLLTAVWVLTMCASADARQFMLPTLHPKTYTAPAGHYALFIDPSDRDGAGIAAYRLSQDGRQVWSATLPITLSDAVVTDDGVVCGYAYNEGYSEIGAAHTSDNKSDFEVVILDANGRIRAQDRIQRTYPPWTDSPRYPLGQGLLVDPANDRLVVRTTRWDFDGDFTTWSDEIWSVYRLSTGERIARYVPKSMMPDSKSIGRIAAARLVPDTPLILTDWRHDDNGQNSGVRFTLNDPAGKPVWSLDLPQDYRVRGKPVASDKVESDIEADGAILHADPPARFTLRFVAANQQVEFAVTPAGSDAWKVVEVGRSRYIPPQAHPNPELHAPIRALRPLGQIVLRSHETPAEPAVRGVRNFIRVGRDRFAFVRTDFANHSELVVVDSTGRAFREVDLEPVYGRAGWFPPVYAWIGGTQILFAPHWRIDFATGRINRCTSLQGLENIRAIAAFADGGFVVLADWSVLCGFDATGRRMWTVTKDPEADPLKQFAPAGVTITSDQKVAVLDNGGHKIKLFDSHGKFLRAIDLQRAWGREPSSVSYIAADRNGGFVVSDFMASIAVVRMSADGKVTSQFAVRYPDGRTFTVLDGAKVGPDGRIWMCDGDALVRLNSKGIIDKVLGERPNPLRLRDIIRLTVDPAGQVYALADRTYAVHLFDTLGRWKRVFVPLPTDFDEVGSMDTELVIGRRCDVYVRGALNGGIVHFTQDGTRRGVQPFDPFSDSTKRSSDPRQGDHWIDAKLLDTSGAVLTVLTHRPDGDWLGGRLRSTMTTGVAPDGSLAVVDGVSPTFDSDHKPVPTVNLYSPQGVPVRTLRLPVSPRDIAYDGKLLLVADTERVLALSTLGKALWEFHPRLPTQFFQPFITDGGRVMALWDGQQTVYRYALP